MVSIITISNSKEKLLKTAQGVIRECKNFNSEWEYIIVECQRENSDRNCISETDAKTEADELENEIKKIKEELKIKTK